MLPMLVSFHDKQIAIQSDTNQYVVPGKLKTHKYAIPSCNSTIFIIPPNQMDFLDNKYSDIFSYVWYSAVLIFHWNALRERH